MKLLFITDTLREGGKERQLIELLKVLSEGEEFDCALALVRDEVHYNELFELDVDVHFLSEGSGCGGDVSVFFNLFRLCRRLKPDVIHTWTLKTSLLAIFPTKRLGAKLVNGSVRNGLRGSGSNLKSRLLSRVSFFFADVVAANSRAGYGDRRYMKRKGVCIHNGFDFSRLSNLREIEAVRESFGICTDKVVGMVGSFIDAKDYGTFIDAAERIILKRDDVTFVAIGDGPDLEGCRERLKPGLEERFKFLGKQKDVESIVNIFDIGVLACNTRGHAEGLSNAIMEYMALGKPVVATNSGGNSELVLHNKTGFIVPAFDPGIMTEKLDYLLTHSDKSTEMGSSGRRHIISHFSFNRMFEAHISLYRTLAPSEFNQKLLEVQAPRRGEPPCTALGSSSSEDLTSNPYISNQKLLEVQEPFLEKVPGPAERNSFKLALLGDIALNGLFTREPEKNSDRFSNVAGMLNGVDLVIANLETPLWGGGELHSRKRERMGVLLYSDRGVVEDVLPMLNIGVVSLANNHIYDCKGAGLRNTAECLESLGIEFTGAGYREGHKAPVKIERKGISVGFLAYVHEATHPLVGGETGIFLNLYDEERIISEIKKLKATCRYVILSLHWGVDYSFYPERWQREAARKFIDAGADIILGHHPHTVQPFEKYNGGYIFYSLGSFCFGDFIYEGRLRSLKRKTKKTILPILSIEPEGELRLDTCISLKELPGNRVTVRKCSLRRFLWVKSRLMKLKHRFKAVDFLINLKETFIDRVIDYFFGYYRNPLGQLLDFRNFKKIAFSVRDFKDRRA